MIQSELETVSYIFRLRLLTEKDLELDLILVFYKETIILIRIVSVLWFFIVQMGIFFYGVSGWIVVIMRLLVQYN